MAMRLMMAAVNDAMKAAMRKGGGGVSAMDEFRKNIFAFDLNGAGVDAALGLRVFCLSRAGMRTKKNYRGRRGIKRRKQRAK